MYVKFELDGSYGFYTPEIHGEEIVDDLSYIKISDALYQEVMSTQGIKYLTRDLQLLPVPLETSFTIKNSKIFEFTKENGFSVQGILPDELLVHVKTLQDYLNSFESTKELLRRIALDNATDEQALKFIEMYEEWKGGILYKKDKRLRHRDEDGITRLYKVRQDHESQDHYPPSIHTASLYLMIGPPEEEGKTLPWEDRHVMGKELYMLNQKVIHRGFIWRSLIDLNSFEPKDENWSAWEKLEEVEDGWEVYTP